MRHSYRPIGTMLGFSLIELMVAMLIGLLVLAGVIQVVLNSKRSFLDNQEVAFIQDNTRYALDIIAKDIRSSGYKGCARDEPVLVNTIKYEKDKSEEEAAEDAEAAEEPEVNAEEGDLSQAFQFGIAPFWGKEAKKKEDLKDPDIADILPTGVFPDTLSMRTLSNEYENSVKLHKPPSTTITTSSKVNFKKGMPIMIVDAKCETIAIVAAGTNGVESNQLQLTEGINCSNGLTAVKNSNCKDKNFNTIKPITSGSPLFPYVVNTYYIGKSSASINQNMPALKRQYLTSVDDKPAFRVEEIAQGVEDMQITYGIDDGNGKVNGDTFVTAENVTDWNSVVAVHVELMLRSNLPVNGPNGYIRKPVATTISLRNYGG